MLLPARRRVITLPGVNLARGVRTTPGRGRPSSTHDQVIPRVSLVIRLLAALPMMKPATSMTRPQMITEDAHASRTIFRLLLSLMAAGRLVVTVLMGASRPACQLPVVIRG
jgi:hypothetical protein